MEMPIEQWTFSMASCKGLLIYCPWGYTQWHDLCHNFVSPQDTIAELSEVFLVNLTSVELVEEDDDSASGNFVIPPSIAEPRSAEVTIPANDGTNGILHFAANSTRYVLVG